MPHAVNLKDLWESYPKSPSGMALNIYLFRGEGGIYHTGTTGCEIENSKPVRSELIGNFEEELLCPRCQEATKIIFPSIHGDRYQECANIIEAGRETVKKLSEGALSIKDKWELFQWALGDYEFVPMQTPAPFNVEHLTMHDGQKELQAENDTYNAFHGLRILPALFSKMETLKSETLKNRQNLPSGLLVEKLTEEHLAKIRKRRSDIPELDEIRDDMLPRMREEILQHKNYYSAFIPSNERFPGLKERLLLDMYTQDTSADGRYIAKMPLAVYLTTEELRDHASDITRTQSTDPRVHETAIKLHKGQGEYYSLAEAYKAAEALESF